jgi:hypothetical protein
LQKELQLQVKPETIELDLKETSKHVSEAISLAVFYDKAKARLQLAKDVDEKFKTPCAIWQQLFASHAKDKDRNAAKIDSLLNRMEGSFGELGAFFESKVKADAASEEEYRQTVVASLDDLEHEGEFGDKLIKFATKWGENKLLGDLAGSVSTAYTSLMGALMNYKSTFAKEGKFVADGPVDKAFGQAAGHTKGPCSMFATTIGCQLAKQSSRR